MKEKELNTESTSQKPIAFNELDGSIDGSYVSIPDTISTQWQEFLRLYPDPRTIPALPAPDDFDAWREVQAGMAAGNVELSEAIVKRFESVVTSRVIHGVSVLDIKPHDWQGDDKIVVYTHGGAYTLESARSTLVSSALFAHRTQYRVISVDYTLAPHAKWPEVTSQVLSVFAGLQEEGFSLEDIAIYGDSAGGSLAAGAVLKMRDDGLGLPAAVVLWSPWSDITETGDSYATLSKAEMSYTYEAHLKPSADAYALPQDQKHPYVSPVYGDYTKGFPPTLIQGGTKELFLSNFVRHYQALDNSGQTVKLDLYEGMPHVFQALLPDSPESKLALEKVATFLQQYLGR